MQPGKTYTITELAQAIQGQVAGDGQTRITGITSADHPLPGHVAFLENPQRLGELEASPLACLIVPTKVAQSKKPLIRVEHPKLAWAQLLNLFFPPRIFPAGISDKDFIAQSARLGKEVTV